jgi:hypothetical protein
MLAPVLIAALSAGAAAPSPVDALAGRYSSHFANGLVTGEKYESDDVLEIVPVDATHAYFRFSLQFYNGHSCALQGIAHAVGDGLAYREGPTGAGEQRCTLTIAHKGAKLGWDDGGGSCSAYCGARGSFSQGSLPWSSKRPITYMARLKGSSQYKDALADWKKGTE